MKLVVGSVAGPSSGIRSSDIFCFRESSISVIPRANRDSLRIWQFNMKKKREKEEELIIALVFYL